MKDLLLESYLEYCNEEYAIDENTFDLGKARWWLHNKGKPYFSVILTDISSMQEGNVLLLGNNGETSAIRNDNPIDSKECDSLLSIVNQYKNNNFEPDNSEIRSLISKFNSIVSDLFDLSTDVKWSNIYTSQYTGVTGEDHIRRETEFTNCTNSVKIDNKVYRCKVVPASKKHCKADVILTYFDNNDNEISSLYLSLKYREDEMQQYSGMSEMSISGGFNKRKQNPYGKDPEISSFIDSVMLSVQNMSIPYKTSFVRKINSDDIVLQAVYGKEYDLNSSGLNNVDYIVKYIPKQEEPLDLTFDKNRVWKKPYIPSSDDDNRPIFLARPCKNYHAYRFLIYPPLKISKNVQQI